MKICDLLVLKKKVPSFKILKSMQHCTWNESQAQVLNWGNTAASLISPCLSFLT
jgi:hypothetical protein